MADPISRTDVPLAPIGRIDPEVASEVPADNASQSTVRVRSRLQLILLVGALQLTLLIVAMNVTITATAIPTIVSDLGDSTGYAWISGAAVLASTAMSPFWVKASDIWGRKPILLIAVAWMAISSIICATAKTMTQLIVGRALQGGGGGSLLQLTLITISDIFSPRRRSLFYASLQVIWAIAGGTGPLVGGLFAERLSWRWCFWINLPISATSFVLLSLFLTVHNPRTRIADGIKAVDWAGSLCIIGLTVMLLIGLDFGGKIYPWNSAKVICLIVFGVLMAIPFVLSEKKLAKFPLMPLSILHERSNVAALGVAFAFAFVNIAGEYYLPLFFQSVKMQSPIESGLSILPLTITGAVSGGIGGIVINRLGRYHTVIMVGLSLMLIGVGLYTTMNPFTTTAALAGFQILVGFGNGLLFDPPLLALAAHVAQDDVATSISTCAFVKNIAMASSIVVSGTLFENIMGTQGPKLEAAGLDALQIQTFTVGASAKVETIKDIQDSAQQIAVRIAYGDSFRYVWIMLAAVAGVAFIAGFFIKDAELSNEHRETRTGLRRREAQD